MIIKMSKKSQALESEVTDEATFRSRRKILKGLGFLGAGSLLPSHSHASSFDWFSRDKKTVFETKALNFSKQVKGTNQELTPESVATSYNNFYEFGTSKTAPKENAQEFKVDPWSLRIDGLVETPLTLGYDDLFSLLPLEERIYRLRCVEAWSMVIPWVGFELGKLIKQANPLSTAKYVKFSTLYDPEQMPGQKNRFVGGGINYPYVEGLRLDEAIHPLAFLSVGMYGKTLPPQNGAPIRLVTPWKYGFKQIKSLVHIRLTDKKPRSSWNKLIPDEYGFYANVNPTVDHPRWSQARERRIMGSSIFDQNRIDTQMFNGYEEVADLYKGMNLRTNF